MSAIPSSFSSNPAAAFLSQTENVLDNTTQLLSSLANQRLQHPLKAGGDLDTLRRLSREGIGVARNLKRNKALLFIGNHLKFIGRPLATQLRTLTRFSGSIISFALAKDIKEGVKFCRDVSPINPSRIRQLFKTEQLVRVLDSLESRTASLLDREENIKRTLYTNRVSFIALETLRFPMKLIPERREFFLPMAFPLAVSAKVEAFYLDYALTVSLVYWLALTSFTTLIPATQCLHFLLKNTSELLQLPSHVNDYVEDKVHAFLEKSNSKIDSRKEDLVQDFAIQDSEASNPEPENKSRLQHIQENIQDTLESIAQAIQSWAREEAVERPLLALQDEVVSALEKINRKVSHSEEKIRNNLLKNASEKAILALVDTIVISCTISYVLEPGLQHLVKELRECSPEELQAYIDLDAVKQHIPVDPSILYLIYYMHTACRALRNAFPSQIPYDRETTLIREIATQGNNLCSSIISSCLPKRLLDKTLIATPTCN